MAKKSKTTVTLVIELPAILQKKLGGKTYRMESAPLVQTGKKPNSNGVYPLYVKSLQCGPLRISSGFDSQRGRGWTSAILGGCSEKLEREAAPNRVSIDDEFIA